MSEGLLHVQARLDALLRSISPQARRELARNIATQLAQSQRTRITAQQNPDGSAFEPRKQQVRSKKKTYSRRVKQKAMFAKLKTARFLKKCATAESAEIGFNGHTALIARVHQYGLVASVRKNKPQKVQYAQRELLGVTDKDLDMIEDFVIAQLARH